MSEGESDSRVARSLTPLIFLGCAALLLALLFGSRLKGPAAKRHFAVGKRLAETRLISLNEGSSATELTDRDFAGRTTLLHFWGPWCGYCMVEMPEMLEIERRFRDSRRVAVRLISCPSQPTEEAEFAKESQAALAKFGTAANIWYDRGYITQGEMSRFGALSGFPTSVVIDAEGKIAAVWNGYDRRFPEEIADFLAAAEKEAR